MPIFFARSYTDAPWPSFVLLESQPLSLIEHATVLPAGTAGASSDFLVARAVGDGQRVLESVAIASRSADPSGEDGGPKFVRRELYASRGGAGGSITATVERDREWVILGYSAPAPSVVLLYIELIRAGALHRYRSDRERALRGARVVQSADRARPARGRDHGDATILARRSSNPHRWVRGRLRGRMGPLVCLALMSSRRTLTRDRAETGSRSRCSRSSPRPSPTSPLCPAGERRSRSCRPTRHSRSSSSSRQGSSSSCPAPRAPWRASRLLATRCSSCTAMGSRGCATSRGSS